MFEPDCIHKKECNDKGMLCANCKHNKKKSFYEPRPWYPIRPWIPYTPEPYKPYVIRFE